MGILHETTSSPCALAAANQFSDGQAIPARLATNQPVLHFVFGVLFLLFGAVLFLWKKRVGIYALFIGAVVIAALAVALLKGVPEI